MNPSKFNHFQNMICSSSVIQVKFFDSSLLNFLRTRVFSNLIALLVIYLCLLIYLENEGKKAINSPQPQSFGSLLPEVLLSFSFPGSYRKFIYFDLPKCNVSFFICHLSLIYLIKELLSFFSLLEFIRFVFIKAQRCFSSCIFDLF